MNISTSLHIEPFEPANHHAAQRAFFLDRASLRVRQKSYFPLLPTVLCVTLLLNKALPPQTHIIFAYYYEISRIFCIFVFGMSDKISIRFYGNRPVRAIWDDENSKWWFSVLDIIAIFNAQDDYAKTRNYWKYLKTKLRKTNPQLVSDTNQLKLKAADGKSYKTDMLDAEGVSQLAKVMPNNKAIGFLSCLSLKKVVLLKFG